MPDKADQLGQKLIKLLEENLDGPSSPREFLAEVKGLLDDGAAINTQDSAGRSLPWYAVCVWFSREEEHEKFLQYFLRNKEMAISARDNSGMTALMEAASLGRSAAVELLLPLLGRGAVNDKDNDGITALMYTMYMKHPVPQGRISKGQGIYSNIAQGLLTAGAEPNAKDKQGRTALIHAALCGAT